jgi:hypothetical protein
VRLSLVWSLLIASLTLVPAAPLGGETGPPQRESVRVFLDCSRGCDRSFIYQDIEFVEFVREPQDADIHLLITREVMGTSGWRYTLEFIGQGRFAGDDARLRFASPEEHTSDDRRRGLTRTIARGLIRYVADLPIAEGIEIRYNPEAPGRPGRPARPGGDAASARDPWNGWVLRVRGNGSFSAEERSGDMTLSGAVSADRTTEQWKVRSSISTWRRSRTFELVNGTTIESRSARHNADLLMVRSISDHLSVGALTSALSSVFLNQDLGVRTATAVEYSYFPYMEATRRQLTALYSLGVNRFDYMEMTIFGKMSEVLFDQNLVVSYDVQEPWGSANLTFEGSNYLHDFDRHRFDFSGGLNVRVLRGLSLNASASAARIRDQLYLPAGDADPEEILLQQRQLGTGYRYSGSMGLSYTFGSIFADVVNPRFAGSSRRF